MAATITGHALSSGAAHRLRTHIPLLDPLLRRENGMNLGPLFGVVQRHLSRQLAALAGQSLALLAIVGGSRIEGA